jgi:hypothetical protein
MPTLPEADDFVNDRNTSLAQLRVACQILGLADSGDVDELRARLNNYLTGYDPDAPIVCLNPNVASGQHKSETAGREQAGQT